MFAVRQILARAIALFACVAGVTGCGQKAPLFMPTEAAAANRATLLQTLRPSSAQPPAAAASGPVLAPAAAP